MQESLERSLNIPSIKLLEQVGAASVINMARRLGIRSNLEYALALTLGVYDVTLLEMTSAFGVFANNGVRNAPFSIKKIISRDNVILQEHKTKEIRVIGKNTVAVLVDMMKGVLSRGTGFRGRIKREAAAKTGTTEEFRDAWFIGFVPQLVTGVWVGNDDNKSMKGVAEVGVCPRMWKSFMQEVLKDKPEIPFPKPEGLVKMNICRDSGLLPKRDCPNNRLITTKFFKNDTPLSSCYIHEIIEEDDEIDNMSIEMIEEELKKELGDDYFD